MKKISLLILVLILNHNYLFSQKTQKQIQVEKYLQKYKESESNWETSDIKSLLENKLDHSKASKSETQKWIIDKLNLYVKKEWIVKGEDHWDPVFSRTTNDYTTYTVLSKEISFDNEYLIISYKFKITDTDSYGKVEFRNSTYKINISNLADLWYNQDHFTFSEFDNKITQIYFEFGKETDIGFRMKKAIVHLCSFYWKKVENETF
jgi:hypothetical protein